MDPLQVEINFKDRPTSNKWAKFSKVVLCFESGGFDGKEMLKVPMEVENVQEEIEEISKIWRLWASTSNFSKRQIPIL
jgi:predicted P-loop ATPase/GTPase